MARASFQLSAGKATFTYDANGNTTSRTVSGTTSYNWDFENRLTSVTLPGTGGTVTFKYDPFGRRIYKSSSAGTTIYAYDGDNAVEELSTSGTAVARYTQGLGIDEPLEMFRSNKWYYYHADGLGSIVALTKSTGTAANTYFGYNTFGGMPAPSETVANPFRFTGREWDSETGLYYYRARYYDSLFGRFLGDEPKRDQSGFGRLPAAPLPQTSPFSYASNNPIVNVDPFGDAASAKEQGVGVESCTYYDQVARQSHCKYHSGSGAFYCRHPRTNLYFLGSSDQQLRAIRKCLIEEDQKARSDPKSHPVANQAA